MPSIPEGKWVSHLPPRIPCIETREAVGIEGSSRLHPRAHSGRIEPLVSFLVCEPTDSCRRGRQMDFLPPRFSYWTFAARSDLHFSSGQSTILGSIVDARSLEWRMTSRR